MLPISGLSLGFTPLPGPLGHPLAQRQLRISACRTVIRWCARRRLLYVVIAPAPGDAPGCGYFLLTLQVMPPPRFLIPSGACAFQVP
ncbi:hypothetical protein EAO73_24115 [Streptomyces sp. col6]|nr:hypothetical protein EAO73_24115 [Streptomyces sp. col6]